MQEENKQEVSALSILDVRKPFKCDDLIDKFKEVIKEGKVNPLEAFTVLKRMQKIPEEVFKDKEVKDLALNEARKHLSGSRKSFEAYSAQISIAATYTAYDFSGCGDPVLDELYKIQTQIKAFIKEREDALKELIKESSSTSMFGMEGSSKEVEVKEIPYLDWKAYGTVEIFKAPRKIQTEGLKYMKI